MSNSDAHTPAQLGYRMPAEWEPHEATWIAWPHNRDDWPGKFVPVPWVYTEIVRHLSRVETVCIVVAGGTMKRRVADLLDRAGVDLERVQFFKAETDRVWLRDSGPTFVIRDQAAGSVSSEESPAEPIGLIDWKFNAWAKYDDHLKDRHIPRRIARKLGLHRWVPRVELEGEPVRVVLEGGAIDVNGRGSLLTTEECLLSAVQCRNPGLDRPGLEQVLADYLGVRNVDLAGPGHRGRRHARPRGRSRSVRRSADRRDRGRAPRGRPQPRAARGQFPAAPVGTRSGRPVASRRRPCPCPSRSSSTASACPPAMPTSTSPTASFWFPPSTTPPIGSP